MKVYISADIEGVTGTSHWDEADKKSSDFSEFQEQMTAGATEIWVKDAHATARNIIASKLPQEVRLIRGWSGHPFSMVQELDETFDAMLLIGYHSPAGSDANPLAHTISGSATYIKINDHYASEFLLNAYAAALVNVPVVFISGDAGLCMEAESLIPNITTVAVMKGMGNSTVSIHPHLALEKIRDGAQTAIEGDAPSCHIELPKRFSVEIKYKNHAKAYQSSFYPGVSLKEPHTILFTSDDYFEVLVLLSFVV